jgi:DNA-binding transcriptional LysR family regulator
MKPPDLRHLRYFVAVGERLHFGRAAASLHLSQPPLSRAIQELEGMIGVQLLQRTRRKVELTPEGLWFLNESRRILREFDDVVREARRRGQGDTGSLRIGFISLADYGVLPEILKAFKTSTPGVELWLREMLSPEQATSLMNGELDLGLLLPPVIGNLDHVVVQRERFLVALPARHRLAKERRKIAVAELATEPFIMTPRILAPGLYDRVIDLASKSGFVPNVAQEAVQMQTVVSLVSSGMGIAIVPASVGNLGRRGVVYRSIRDAHPSLEVWLAWRRDSTSAAARRFTQTASRLRR